RGAALQDSKQAARPMPRRPAPTPSMETASFFIKAKNQHSARPRPSARQPTPSVEQQTQRLGAMIQCLGVGSSRQKQRLLSHTPRRLSRMSRRGLCCKLQNL
ncbi:hypothetical protein PIB30_102128, partial [Stylosanthes scabra]|nr:hypothetical protein [Stylosanthes scabra]